MITMKHRHRPQLGIIKLNPSDIPQSMNERRCMALKIGINRRSILRQSRFSSAGESARGTSSSTLRTSSNGPLSMGPQLWLFSVMDMMDTIPLWRGFRGSWTQETLADNPSAPGQGGGFNSMKGSISTMASRQPLYMRPDQ